MYVAYENQCGNCKYYDYQGDNTKGYCSYYREYYYPGEECSHQDPRQKSYSSGPCYITTIVCTLLGQKDDCEILRTLRKLREQMQQNPECRNLLYEYDTVGPQIAKCLEEDKDYELANGMLDCYMIPTVYLTREGKYEEAIKKYATMTRALENYYGIKFDEKVPENYDQKNGGHGYVKTI